MLKGLRNFVAKEVKEMLRDPRILLGMILVPLLVFPLMGGAIRISTEAMRESVKTLSIAVVDLDNDVVARNLTDFLESVPNVSVERIDALSMDEVAASLQDSNVTAVIMIPEDFSQNITNGNKAELSVYAVFREGSLAESISFSSVQTLVDAFEKNVIHETVQERFPNNPDVVLDPVDIYQKTIFKGKPADANPSAFFTFAQSQFFSLPFALFMLIILAMQLAATSVASEKEEKTLETLMSLPLSRFTMLIGKLAGSTIVAAIGAIATIFGVIYYMGSFTFGGPTLQPTVDLSAVGLTPSILGYALLGVSVFVALLWALALAVVVSVFAEDVRGAQSLLGFVYMPMLIPMFVLMFADLNALPFALRVLVLALPFTHPMLAARAMITENYLTALLGIGYMTMFTLAILYVAARIFGTEKILTMRLRLRRQKPKREE